MSDKWGSIKTMRLAFLIMIPAMFFLTHSTNEWVAMLLLVPAGFAVFTVYSPIVYLGQTYLAKNVGFASGVTMGLGTTVGGLMAPFVGHLADNLGIGAALNVLWLSGVVAAIFSFIVPEPKK